ncbi:MAG: hypothetical protein FWC90_03615 [Oscillospiraceae bacterium]|nr:hypothetical protein [Oscillospiraceae bacterium]
MRKRITATLLAAVLIFGGIIGLGGDAQADDSQVWPAVLFRVYREFLVTSGGRYYFTHDIDNNRLNELFVGQPGDWTVFTFSNGLVLNAGSLEADRIFGTHRPEITQIITMQWVDEAAERFTASGYTIVHNRLQRIFHVDEWADEVYISGYGMLNLRNLHNDPSASPFFEPTLQRNQNTPEGTGALFSIMIISFVSVAVVVPIGYYSYRIAKRIKNKRKT